MLSVIFKKFTNLEFINNVHPKYTVQVIKRAYIGLYRQVTEYQIIFYIFKFKVEHSIFKRIKYFVFHVSVFGNDVPYGILVLVEYVNKWHAVSDFRLYSTVLDVYKTTAFPHFFQFCPVKVIFFINRGFMVNKEGVFTGGLSLTLRLSSRLEC